MKVISSDVKDSGFVTLICDETTLHNRSFITISAHFVDAKTKNVMEETFIMKELESFTASLIFNVIKNSLQKLASP